MRLPPLCVYVCVRARMRVCVRAHICQCVCVILILFDLFYTFDIQ